MASERTARNDKYDKEAFGRIVDALSEDLFTLDAEELAEENMADDSDTVSLANEVRAICDMHRFGLENDSAKSVNKSDASLGIAIWFKRILFKYFVLSKKLIKIFLFSDIQTYYVVLILSFFFFTNKLMNTGPRPISLHQTISDPYGYSEDVPLTSKDLPPTLSKNDSATDTKNNIKLIIPDENISYDSYNNKKYSSEYIENMSEKINADPGNYDAFQQRGLLYLISRRIDFAIKDFSQVVKLTENISDVSIRNKYLKESYSDRAMAYFLGGDEHAAISDFTIAIAIDPKDADLRNDRGIVYAIIGDDVSAIGDFASSIYIAPNSSYARNNQGAVNLKIGAINSAMSELTDAIGHGQLGMAYKNRGIADLIIKDFKRAASDFDSAITIDPLSLDSYIGCLVSYTELNNTREALLCFKKAIQIDNSSAPAYNRLGIMYIKEGNFDAGIHYLSDAYRYNPKRSFRRDLLAAQVLKQKNETSIEKTKSILDLPLIYDEIFPGASLCGMRTLELNKLCVVPKFDPNR